ncbi:MAG: RecX family transcriptional regulator [Lactobacillaceae bacterium]|jgi:regulatory protein|nr:RecX family transcriptional regulator [Lactobacillaceae bacterium]
MAKTITRIYTQKRQGRFNVDLDNQYAFSISNDTFVKFSLFKGTQLDDSEISEIKRYDQFSILKNKALIFINHQQRSQKEVVDKLKTNDDIPLEIIDEVVNELKNIGLINDQEYAKNFISTQINASIDGPSVIKQKLFKKGVPSFVVEKAIVVFDTQTQTEHIAKLADKFISINQKKLGSNALKNKLYSFLYSKGYSTDLIKEYVDNVILDENDDQQLMLAKNALQKIWTRYQKYGNQRKYRASQFLYSKGFSADNIDIAIREQENEGK